MHSYLSEMLRCQNTYKTLLIYMFETVESGQFSHADMYVTILVRKNNSKVISLSSDSIVYPYILYCPMNLIVYLHVTL